MSREQFEAAAREAAAREGVPWLIFDRQITQESGWDPLADSGVAKGIAQIIPEFHPGVDPWDPIASLNYAAKWDAGLRRTYGSWRNAMIAYNWGPGNFLKWQKLAGANPDLLPSETRRYLDVILGTGWPEPGEEGGAIIKPYNPDFPLRLQVQQWACSIRSLQMALESIGITPEIGQLQDMMVADGVVNADVGLTRADGSLLVDFIARHWPETDPYRIAPAGFDQALNIAGLQPMMLGGHGWGGVGHWVAVRRVDKGRLILANPGGTGPVFGQQSLGRDDWARIADSWTIVALGVDPGVDDDEAGDPSRIRDLETALADICRGSVRSAIADLRGKPLDEVVTEVGHILSRLSTIADQFGV